MREVLAHRVAAEFVESRSHTPKSIVLSAAAQARQVEADGLIGVGGGSVIDLCKAIALVLAEGDDLERHRIRFTVESGIQTPDLRNPKLPQIALPTTLSGAEFTGGVAVTDDASREKSLYVDPKLTPRWVFLDPELTRFTPPLLWAATGMKVFADCLEMLCSPRATPYTDALALHALRLLYENLVTSSSHPEDASTRSQCQFAAFMVLPQALNTGLGIVTGLRHQIGAAFGVPHGVASSIILPHALRWNLSYAVQPLARAARALGMSHDADADAAAEHLIHAADDMIARLGLPRRLRDVGVPKDAERDIARHAAADFLVATNPRPVRGAEDLVEVLAAAW
jgi:alcohol dehydrogenase class IV